MSDYCISPSNREAVVSNAVLKIPVFAGLESRVVGTNCQEMISSKAARGFREGVSLIDASF